MKKLLIVIIPLILSFATAEIGHAEQKKKEQKPATTTSSSSTSSSSSSSESSGPPPAGPALNIPIVTKGLTGDSSNPQDPNAPRK